MSATRTRVVGMEVGATKRTIGSGMFADGASPLASSGGGNSLLPCGCCHSSQNLARSIPELLVAIQPAVNAELHILTCR
jgi:hypothetical protein